MKIFKHSDVIRSGCIRDTVRATLQNQRRLAGMLLLSTCVVAYSKSPTTPEQTPASEADRCNNPGDVLKETLRITANGPYEGQAGLPITLHGSYIVEGQKENSDRLKVIGQALQSYLKDHGSYPPAALLNADDQRTVSWRVLILPYLGEKDLYERFDLSRRWDESPNLHLLGEMPDVYRKSDDRCDRTETGFAGVDGPQSLFQNASAELNGGRKDDMISVVQQLAVAPVGEEVHLPWTAPGDIDSKHVGKLGSRRGFSGEGHAFTPLLFLDGSVHLMPDDVDAGAINTWTHISENMKVCICAPPSSLDARLIASWDLGKNATVNTEGWDVTFLAHKPGTYTVTMHVSDSFGNEYNTSTKVEVR